MGRVMAVKRLFVRRGYMSGRDTAAGGGKRFPSRCAGGPKGNGASQADGARGMNEKAVVVVRAPRVDGSPQLAAVLHRGKGAAGREGAAHAAPPAGEPRRAGPALGQVLRPLPGELDELGPLRDPLDERGGERPLEGLTDGEV